jgi:hypothetical protein
MHDIVSLADDLKGNSLPIHLGAERWNSFSTAASLKWCSVPWNKRSMSKVPARRGIYAFTIRFRNSLLPEHGYILYVGIAGDEDSRGTLRTRFSRYFREARAGRSRVHYFLNKWRSHLTFQYSEVPDKRFSLEKIEEQLCDAIVPFASRNDLSATLRKAKEAAGL